MRSELVFGGLQHIANRYQLVSVASRAVRAFHRPNTRIAETVSDVFLGFRFEDQARVRQINLR